MHTNDARTYVDAGVGPYLLLHELPRDAKFVHPKVPALEIAKPLPEARVAPDALHHAKTERVEVPLEVQRGHLLRRRPPHGLKPVHQILLILKVRHHVAAARGRRIRPRFAHVHRYHTVRLEPSHRGAVVTAGDTPRWAMKIVSFIKL